LRCVSLVSRGRLSPLADSLDRLLPNPSCGRSYAGDCGHTRGNFRLSEVLGSQQGAGAVTHFGRGIEDDGTELVDAHGTQLVEPIGHRFLVADDGGILGIRVTIRPSRCPVLPSGRGVRRQHGAIPCIEWPRAAVTPSSKYLVRPRESRRRPARPRHRSRSIRAPAARSPRPSRPSSRSAAWPAARRSARRSRRTGGRPPATSR
jgi:hypothetical protein